MSDITPYFSKPKRSIIAASFKFMLDNRKLILPIFVITGALNYLLSFILRLIFPASDMKFDASQLNQQLVAGEGSQDINLSDILAASDFSLWSFLIMQILFLFFSLIIYYATITFVNEILNIFSIHKGKEPDELDVCNQDDFNLPLSNKVVLGNLTKVMFSKHSMLQSLKAVVYLLAIDTFLIVLASFIIMLFSVFNILSYLLLIVVSFIFVCAMLYIVPIMVLGFICVDQKNGTLSGVIENIVYLFRKNAGHMFNMIVYVVLMLFLTLIPAIFIPAILNSIFSILGLTFISDLLIPIINSYIIYFVMFSTYIIGLFTCRNSIYTRQSN